MTTVTRSTAVATATRTRKPKPAARARLRKASAPTAKPTHAAASFTAGHPAPIQPAQNRFPPAPAGNLPLDYNVKVPAALVQRYPKVFFTGADLNSHLELETKWKVELNDVAGYKAKLDQMVKDPKLTEQVLGKGWKVTANTRYVGKPMVDNYDDDPASLPITRKHGVLRDRSVEGDRFNNINFKPDGGKRGKTVYDPVVRGEFDLAVKKEVRNDPGLLAGFIGSGEHLDVTRFGPKFDPRKLEVVSTLSDVRAKYNFEHVSGLAIEASLDDVTWSTHAFKDQAGKPITVRFAQLEMEKEHLAFGGTGGGKPAAAATAAKPARAPGAPNGDDPLAWLRNQSGPVSFGGAPRIHTPGDIDSPAVRQTPDYGLQVGFNKALGGFLYGKKAPTQAEQKNYTGFELAAKQSGNAQLKKLLGH